MTIYSLDVLISLFGTNLFLTVASWPAYRFLKRQVRWSGIPISFRIFQFVVIHTVKGFGIVNKAEVDVFLELSCFFDDPVDVSNLISGSSAFSKTSLNIWNFTVQVLLNQLMTKCLQKTANGKEIESILYLRNWTLVRCLLYTLVSFTDSNLVSPLFNFSSQFKKLRLGTVPWVPQVAESVCNQNI